MTIFHSYVNVYQRVSYFWGFHVTPWLRCLVAGQSLQKRWPLCQPLVEAGWVQVQVGPHGHGSNMFYRRLKMRWRRKAPSVSLILICYTIESTDWCILLCIHMHVYRHRCINTYKINVSNIICCMLTYLDRIHKQPGRQADRQTYGDFLKWGYPQIIHL